VAKGLYVSITDRSTQVCSNKIYPLNLDNIIGRMETATVDNFWMAKDMGKVFWRKPMDIIIKDSFKMTKEVVWGNRNCKRAYFTKDSMKMIIDMVGELCYAIIRLFMKVFGSIMQLSMIRENKFLFFFKTKG